MERPQYCVYNQTNECFLSLGVTPGANTFARFKGVLSGRPYRYDEGNWVLRPRGVHFFRLFSSRDLLFLDEKQCVIDAIESFPALRFAPIDTRVASALALPIQTIESSQTQPGHQLVICGAEEMEFRLRSMPDLQKEEPPLPSSASENLPAANRWNMRSFSEERRTSRRKRWPRLIAYDSTGGTLEVHGVKDLSTNGLYLMTEERWPLGTQVTMTLQRTDGLAENFAKNTITVQLRVVRWGKDGVGLAFMQSETEESPVLALTSAR